MTGCKFMHSIEKNHKHSFTNHLHLVKHAAYHRPKDKSSDKRVKRKNQSLINIFFTNKTKKECGIETLSTETTSTATSSAELMTSYNNLFVSMLPPSDISEVYVHI